MKILAILRVLLLSLAASLAIAGPAMANTQEGVVIENRDTGARVWVPDSYFLLLNSGADGEGMSAAREATGCTGWFDLGVFGNCSATEMNNRQAEDAGIEQFYDSSSGNIVQNYNERGSWALILFDYAAGFTGATCITCDFMAYFMAGLTDFSEAVYKFFIESFLTFVPIMLAIWIAYRTAKMVSVGGEDGRSFLYSIVQKFALFTMLFLFFSQTVSPPDEAPGGQSSEHYAWNMVGPQYLDFAFNLASEIRNKSIAPIASSVGATSVDGRLSPYGCANILPAATSGKSAELFKRYSYIKSGVEVSCVTERTHIVGISTGLAVMFSSFTMQDSEGVGSTMLAFGKALVTAVNRFMMGTLMTAIYLMSAVWLIFLTLDIVVRAMITAAFAPLLGALFLWQPTRGLATNAIKAFFGATMTAVALSIVSVLALYLMTNTLAVYDNLWDTVKDDYNSSYKMAPITETGLSGMRTFISRTQETDPNYDRIPMDWGTPWYWYLALVGLAVFALGKKIIRMLEQVLDYQGMSAFADAATKNFKTAAFGSMLAAGGTAFLGKKAVGLSIGGAGLAFGATKAAAAGGLGAGALHLGGAMKSKFFNNPFGNTERASLNNVLAKGAKIKMGAGGVKGALDQADEAE